MASKTIVNVPRMSRVFHPMASGLMHDVVHDSGGKAEVAFKGQELLLNYGMMKPAGSGMYALLPLGMRVLDKLINLVDEEMTSLGAQKILLPALTSAALWKKTGRYRSNRAELFTLTDRHEREYLLSPTYEEAICDVISSTGPLSSKLLPLRLYQISSKWRDEMKPRLGFLRSREFIMKDLYTFDACLDGAQQTYDLVCRSYENIFRQIGINHVKAVGDAGTIGGLKSHEYHYVSDIGEDVILQCPACQFSINRVVCETTSCCPECKSQLHPHNSAEVGHVFLLSTQYSEPLKALFAQQHEFKPLIMGCFGLGLSRILALVVDALSINDEIRWPVKLAPYTACVIPPKKGSKEEVASVYVEQLFNVLQRRGIDAILDDRTSHTIGKRLKFARAIGYPYVIVLGRTVTQSASPLFEVHDLNNKTYQELSLEQINDYFDDVNLKLG